MQLALLFSILFAFVPNLAIAGHSLAELMEASDEESQREQRELAQISPEQEEQIERELLEEVSQTVGPMHVEEAELKEPKGVAGLCRKLSQKFDCEKAKRSKETCLEAKALLEEMALGLSSSSPADGVNNESKTSTYLAEARQILRETKNNKKKQKISRRKRRGLRQDFREMVGGIWWTEMKELWAHWWLAGLAKDVAKQTALNKQTYWKRGKYAKFVGKLLRSIFGVSVAGIIEFPAKIAITLVTLLVAITFSLVD